MKDKKTCAVTKYSSIWKSQQCHRQNPREARLFAWKANFSHGQELADANSKRRNGVRAFLVSQAERWNWPFIQTMEKAASERHCSVYAAAQMTAGNSWVRTVSCTLNNGAQIMRLQMSPAAFLRRERFSTTGWHPLSISLAVFLSCENSPHRLI